MKYIVSVSGGLGSAEALRRCIEKYGRENVDAVFCDVRGNALMSHAGWSMMPVVDDLLHQRFGGETRDTYRFLFELSHALDIPIERIEDGRTIWAVFVQYKAFRLVNGATFFCKASEQLKRDVFEGYLTANYKPGEYTIVLGMGWDEEHRIKSAQGYWRAKLGWDVEIVSPLTEKPYPENINIADSLKALGVETIPDAYTIGLEHNNCSGICVMAGLTHYAKLYHERPEHYHYAAWMEQRVNAAIGKEYTILKDQRGGNTTRLTMYEYLERIQSGDYPKYDFGGCGCFTNVPMDFVQHCEIKKPKSKSIIKMDKGVMNKNKKEKKVDVYQDAILDLIVKIEAGFKPTPDDIDAAMKQLKAYQDIAKAPDDKAKQLELIK